MIKNKKKYLKYKNYDEIMRFIDSRENEITKDFGDRCQESKKYIEEAITNCRI
jgi:ribosomal protein S18